MANRDECGGPTVGLHIPNIVKFWRWNLDIDGWTGCILLADHRFFRRCTNTQNANATTTIIPTISKSSSG